jgi:ssDNA-binding replication factor A large subunit
MAAEITTDTLAADIADAAVRAAWKYAPLLTQDESLKLWRETYKVAAEKTRSAYVMGAQESWPNPYTRHA